MQSRIVFTIFLLQPFALQEFINECNELKVTGTKSESEGNALELSYRGKSRQMLRFVRCNKGEFIIVLIRDAETDTNNNDFATACRITKDLHVVPFPVKDVNAELSVYDIIKS